MARDGDAVDNAVYISGLTETFSSWSFHAWVWGDTAPGSSSISQAFICTNDVENNMNFGISWSHTSASFRGVVQFRSQGTWYSATYGTLNGSTWYALGGSFDTTTKLKAWKDGVETANNTSPGAETNSVQRILALGGYNSGFQNHFDGAIGECAVWQGIALTANEFAMLAAGFSPIRVRPENLFLYWPLWGIDDPEPDFSGNGRNGTLRGAPGGRDNPPVASPFAFDESWMPYEVPPPSGIFERGPGRGIMRGLYRGV